MKKRVACFLLSLVMLLGLLPGIAFAEEPQETPEMAVEAEALETPVALEETEEPEADTPDQDEAEGDSLIFDGKQYRLTDDGIICDGAPAFPELSDVRRLALANETLYAIMGDEEQWIAIEQSTDTVALFGSSAAENERAIYDFAINSLGVNVAAACGILANIEAESSFNPNCSFIEKDGRTSYGLCQWNNSRLNSLKSFCSERGLDYTTLEGQLQFLQSELNGSEKSAWNKVRNVDNTADGAYTAGYNWAQWFERCASEQFEKRAVKARDAYWVRYGNISPILLSTSDSNAFWPLGTKGYFYGGKGYSIDWPKYSESKRDHSGTDIVAPSGTPIFASYPGKITTKDTRRDSNGNYTGFGNYIVIQCSIQGTTLYVLYAHMSKFADVKVGDYVEAKQIIGYVGQTGNATGPHLHYQVSTKGGNVWQSSETLNPANYLPSGPESVHHNVSSEKVSSIGMPDAARTINVNDSYYFNLDLGAGQKMANIKLYVTPPGKEEYLFHDEKNTSAYGHCYTNEKYIFNQQGIYAYRWVGSINGKSKSFSGTVSVGISTPKPASEIKFTHSVSTTPASSASLPGGATSFSQNSVVYFNGKIDSGSAKPVKFTLHITPPGENEVKMAYEAGKTGLGISEWFWMGDGTPNGGYKLTKAGDYKYRIHAEASGANSKDVTGTIRSVGSFNFTMNSNGGSGSIGGFTVSYGDTFTIPANKFTKAGYTFVGWNVKRNADNKWHVSGKGWFTESEIAANGFTKNLYRDQNPLGFNASWTNGYNSENSSYTFYAVWEANSYTFAMNSNGGNGSLSGFTATYNANFKIPANAFSKTGYTFTGWNVRRDKDNKWYVGGKGWFTESDISSKGYTKCLYEDKTSYTFNEYWTDGYEGVSSYTFYAQWQQNIQYYTLDLQSNLDGVDCSSLNGFGIADIYINGTLVKKDADDYCQQWPAGTSYEIKNIRATDRKLYLGGVSAGSLSGTLNGNTYIYPKFISNADIGTNFYAFIKPSGLDKYLSVENDNYNVASHAWVENVSQVWFFERQSDGSYRIKSPYNDRFLDVLNESAENGANVGTCDFYDNNAQRWYVFSVDGGYQLRAKCTNCVLDFSGNNEGDNAYMYPNWCGWTQKYEIQKAGILDVNWMLDNQEQRGVQEYGTVDIYINGTLVKNDVPDYVCAWPLGISYEIADVKSVGAHTYNGVTRGNLSGTLNDVNTEVWLSFSTITGSEMIVGYERTLPDGDYMIVSAGAADKSKYFYLDIDGSDQVAKNGTNVHLWGPSPSDLPLCDIWTITYQDGFYSIKQKGTNMALDVEAVSALPGANVQVWESLDNSAQRWAISNNGRNGYRVQAKCSGYSLDITGGHEEPEINIQQWLNNDLDAQSWLFIPYQPEQPIQNGRYVLLSAIDPSCELDVAGDSGDIPENTNVQIWNDNCQSKYNSFEITALKNGYYVLIHSASQLILNVEDGLSENGTNVSVHIARGGFGEQWAITPHGNGFVLRSLASGHALNVHEGKKSDGTNVEQQYYNGSAQQTWLFVSAEYNITFDANGGANAPSKRTKYYKEDFVIDNNIPSRADYEFLGWAENAAATEVKYQPGDSFTKDADTTLYAVWKKARTEVEKITVSPETAILTVGGTRTLKATVSPDNATDKTVTWTSSNTAVAKVSSSGKVTAVKAGTATITAQAGGKSATCKVTVTPVTYTVTYDANGGVNAPPAQTKTQGVALTISATIPSRPNHDFLGWAQSATATEAQYQPGDSFTIDANATLYAVWKQSAIVVHKITVSPETATLTVGGTRTLKATVSPDNATDKTVTWTSSNTAVAKVSSSGKVTAVKAGTATITAQAGGKSAICKVTVVKESDETSAQIITNGSDCMVGESIALPVYIENNPGIAGAAFTVSYDTTAMTLTAIEKGAVFSTGSFSANAGLGLVQWYSIEAGANTTTNGILFTLRFTVKVNAKAGTYPVTIQVKDQEGGNFSNKDFQPVPVQFQNAEITVTDGVKGDVTGDNKVLMNDVVKLASSVMGFITLTTQERALGDVTGDNKVLMNDVVKVASFVAGYIPTLAPATNATMLAEPQSAVITVASVSAGVGDTVRVPVTIDVNPGIAGAMLEIKYNESDLSLSEIERGTVFSNGTFQSDIEKGQVQWYDVGTFSDTTTIGVMFTLVFTVLKTDAEITVQLNNEEPANLTNVSFNSVPVIINGGVVSAESQASIQSVSFNRGEATVALTSHGQKAIVLCAAYDVNGKHLSAQSKPVNNNQTVTFTFSESNISYVKAFLLDEQYHPLADCKHS